MDAPVPATSPDGSVSAGEPSGTANGSGSMLTAAPRQRPPRRSGATCTNGVTGSGDRAPPSPRPAEKNAAHVPSELTIGAPSGFWGVQSVP